MVRIIACQSEPLGRMVYRFLCVAIILFGFSVASFEGTIRADINDYIVKPATPGQRFDSEGVALPPDVWKRLGSGRYRQATVSDPLVSSPCPDFFFSPDGETLYVRGSHQLTAIDPASGQIRFEFRYGGNNNTARSLGTQGVRIDLYQGPLANSYVVLEHGTGKILEHARGKAVDFGVLGPTNSFLSATRRFRFDEERLDPSPIAKLLDARLEEVVATIGKVDGFGGSIAVSPSERRFAAVVGASELQIFDSVSGKLLKSQSIGDLGQGNWRLPVWSSNDSSVFVCEKKPGKSETFRLIEVFADSLPSRTIADGLEHVVNGVVLSPDGKYLACRRFTGHDRRTQADWIVFHRAGTGIYCEIDSRPAHTDGMFSPDGRYFWLAGSGVARFDLSMKRFLPNARDALMPVTALEFSMNGSQLHAAFGDEIRTWDVASGALLPDRVRMPDVVREGRFVRCVKIDPDGKGAIWAGESCVCYLRNEEISRFNAANCHPHSDYVLSDDGRRIVFDDYYGDLRLGDVRSGTVLKTLLPRKMPRQDYLIYFAPDGETLAMAHRDYKAAYDEEALEVEFRKLSADTTIRTIGTHGKLQQSVFFSRDGREATVGVPPRMTTWDLTSGTAIGNRLMTPPRYLAAWSPSRRRYIGEHRELVDALTGETCIELKTLEDVNHTMTASVFSPDGTMLAIAADEAPIYLIDVYGKYRPDDPRDTVALAVLWDQLANGDSRTAFQAIGAFIRRADSVQFLKEKLIVSDPSAEEIDGFIRDLDADEFDRRQLSDQALRASSDGVLPRLLVALERTKSPEQKKRLDGIIANHRSMPPAPDRLRELRCIEVLEAIGSADAKDLLTDLSKRPGESRLARDAQAALRQQ